MKALTRIRRGRDPTEWFWLFSGRSVAILHYLARQMHALDGQGSLDVHIAFVLTLVTDPGRGIILSW